MPLIVYKSSAGSGKTTTLVREYLKITLLNPADFRHVLAITFTNKAANEMKDRILKTLQELISGTAWESDEIKPLINELNMDKELLQARSKTLRSLIIHRYEEFAVSTIDAFVHRIVRTFAADVKLPQNFEVVLDKDEIVPEIISDLYRKMETDPELTKIMVNFVLSKIDDGKYYDPTTSLSQFIEKQMEEEGFQYVKKIEGLLLPDFVGFITALQKGINKHKKLFQQQAGEALLLISNAHLEKSAFFQGKGSIAAYFEKVQNFGLDKNLFTRANADKTIDLDKWYSGSASISDKAAIDGIKSQLTQLYISVKKEIDRYFFLRLLYRKIYTLALVKEIRDLVADFSERTQKVHISEFNKKISDEISDQPVPFIYERLGRKYRYFLIDEFQDTSLLQWQNLLPLIEESLSYNSFNMLVGDAKQAIYRFRNGEVELFASLPKIYQSDNSVLSQSREAFLASHYKEERLEVNYRSHGEIVEFNNDFFEQLKTGFSERLLQIYQSHQQILPPGKDKTGGYVQMDLLESDSKEAYAIQRLELIQDDIDILLAAGFGLKDVCILTRTNKSAIEIATFLLSNQIKVVSSESLLLSNSPEVRLIVAFFKLLLQPNEKIVLSEFLVHLIASGKIEGDFHDIYCEILRRENDFLDSVKTFFKENTDFEKLNGRPVYEIAEFIIRDLLQSEKVNIFLQYFLDFVFSAQSSGKESIAEFLELWEDKKEKLYISMPEGGDAVQIMTAHKAKGLKFQAVIADLYNTSNRNTKTEYWTDIEEETLPGLSVGLFPLSGDLNYLGWSAVVEEEKDKNTLDFLNLVYVAFTRPVQALFAIGKDDNRDKFGKYLKQYIDRKGQYTGGTSRYSIGKPSYKGKQKYVKDNGVKLDKMISTSWEELIQIAPADELYWEAINSKPSVTYGKLVHALMAKVQYAADVEAVAEQARLSGLIDEEETEKIRLLMNAVVYHPALENYFHEGVLVKNETEVFDQNGRLQRPDRVIVTAEVLCVIDYKTGIKSNAHIEQIQSYSETFKRMGYQNVLSKLVYLDEGVEVVEV